MAAEPVQSVLAGMVLIGVVVLVAVRPRGLDVAWFSGVGALVVLVLGVLPVRALGAIFADTWDAAATLIALFILSETLESNGFFKWAALWLARAARGSGWRLYLLVLFLTTGVTALLANDGSVLILTPIYVALLKAIYPDQHTRLPFLFAAGFFADAMSGLLLPSNLTNIILADANGLRFAQVAQWMLLPTACVFVAAGGAFALRFRHALRVPYATEALAPPPAAIRDGAAFVAGWIALVGLIIGYIVGGERHLPVSLIAGSAALAMLALAHLRRLRSAGAVLRAAPWSILLYALGMFVVITAAYQTHDLAPLTHALREHVSSAAGTGGGIFAGGLLALLAAAANNLPATLVGVLALRESGQISRIAIYAIMLGVDIGPKLTPFGSLATLLWLGILGKNDVPISWGTFMRENWWVTVLALLAAGGGLLVTSALLTG